MKICIIGPVYTKSCFGGVATFTEGLADGFKLNGDEVVIITDYTERNNTIYGTPIIGTFNRPSRKNIRMPNKIYNEIVKFNPDMIITSLEYGLVNYILKKNNKLIETVHYLHAFPSVKRTVINNMFVEKITRFICRHSKYIISNSTLTSVINAEIFNIPSDEIINIGIGYDFISKLDNVEDIPFNINKKNILFVGRLVKEKNVDLIIEAFKRIKRNDIVLNIIGEGNEEEKLKLLAKEASNEIIFHGKVSPKDMPKYYKGADVFISLNPHEPYGIVYLEALCSATAIVCPRTGGQMDTLLDYKDRVKFINPKDCEDISVKLEQAIDLKFIKLDKKYIEDRFSYKRVATDIKKFLKYEI